RSTRAELPGGTSLSPIRSMPPGASAPRDGGSSASTAAASAVSASEPGGGSLIAAVPRLATGAVARHALFHEPHDGAGDVDARRALDTLEPRRGVDLDDERPALRAQQVDAGDV